MSDRTAFPEWLSRDDTATESWVVSSGTPQRGDAWTDITNRRMRVPGGDDEVSRVIRAHEMVHAKVSPIRGVPTDLAAEVDVSPEALVVAEEFRVNMLASQAGFDMDELRDGSEKRAGELMGKNTAWNDAVRAVCAMAGTKAADDFLRGVASQNKEMADNLRVVHRELKKRWKKALRDHDVDKLSSTEPARFHASVPAGFMRFTVPIAKYLDNVSSCDNEDPYASDPGDSPIPDGDALKGGEVGRFAKLVERTLPKPKHVDGRFGRKRKPSAIGKHPRRIDRMLTDPDKRIFDRRAKSKGGVILIDQSGSMSLDDDDIWSIIEHAPGCVIIGYAHETGSEGVPNVWVLADRGRVVDNIPYGNSGNGVDGPAVRFAASKRRKGEPFVWVCDGIVTDGLRDSQYTNLDLECIQLVRKHGIHMVPDVSGAVDALKRVASGSRLPIQYTGTLVFRATDVS